MPEREQHEDHHRARSLWLWSVAWSVGLLLLMQPGPATGQTDAEIEEVFWESVECESVRQVELYLEIYPTGRYVAEAHECLEGQLGLDRAARILVQQGLAALEYEVGAADGLFGPATRRAIRAWQTAKEFAGTGYLTRAQAETLMAQGREVVARAQAAAQRAQEEVRRQAAVEQEQREAERRRQRAEAERQARAEREAQARRQAQEADDAAYEKSRTGGHGGGVWRVFAGVSTGATRAGGENTGESSTAGSVKRSPSRVRRKQS